MNHYIKCKNPCNFTLIHKIGVPLEGIGNGIYIIKCSKVWKKSNLVLLHVSKDVRSLDRSILLNCDIKLSFVESDTPVQECCTDLRIITVGT